MTGGTEHKFYLYTEQNRMIILITFLFLKPCPHMCGFLLFYKHIFWPPEKKKTHNTPTIISNNHMQALRQCQGKPITFTRKETKNGLPEKAQQKKNSNNDGAAEKEVRSAERQ